MLINLCMVSLRPRNFIRQGHYSTLNSEFVAAEPPSIAFERKHGKPFIPFNFLKILPSSLSHHSFLISTRNSSSKGTLLQYNPSSFPVCNCHITIPLLLSSWYTIQGCCRWKVCHLFCCITNTAKSFVLLVLYKQ